MKAYKCQLPYDELQKIKIEFWSNLRYKTDSKKENKRIWLILKQCCETDAYSAKELLSSAQLDVLDNCMKAIVDQSGTVYQLPNFMINDPLHIKEFDKLKNLEIPETILILYLLDVFQNTQFKIEVQNNKTGKDLKLIFCDIIKLEMKNYKIRLLCKGHEIQDDHFLHFHSIDEGNNKVQVTYRLLDNSEKEDMQTKKESNISA